MKIKFQLKFYEKIIILLLVLIATLLIFSYIYNPIIIEGNKYKVYEDGNNGSKEHKKSVEKDKGKRDEVNSGTYKAFESHAKMVGEKK